MRVGCCRRSSTAVLVAVCWALPPTPAFADPVRPVQLSYAATATCPSESDFLDMVAADGGRLVRSLDAAPARSFSVQVTGGHPATGKLVTRESGGGDAVRELDGADCDDVARAIALVVAMSVDAPYALPPLPLAAETPPVAPEPATGAAAPLPPVPGLAASTPGNDALLEPDEVRREAPRAPHGRRIDFSAEGTLGTGTRPSISPGLAVYLEWLNESPKLLSPSIRAGFQLDKEQAWTDLIAVQRVVGRLDACALRAVVSQPWSDDAFSLEPCLRIDVGNVNVRTWANGSEVEEHALWFAPAGILRLRYLTRGLFFELEGGVVVPLVRERFAFGPDAYPNDARDFEIPPIAVTSGLGFGVFLFDDAP
jgi:hypothetical protein